MQLKQKAEKNLKCNKNIYSNNSTVIQQVYPLHVMARVWTKFQCVWMFPLRTTVGNMKLT